jgi:hypothetical protein
MTIRIKPVYIFFSLIVAIFLVALTFSTFSTSEVRWFWVAPLMATILWLYYVKKFLIDVKVQTDKQSLTLIVPRVKFNSALRSFSISFPQYNKPIAEIQNIKLWYVKNPTDSFGGSFVGKGQLTITITDNNGKSTNILASVFSYRKMEKFFKINFPLIFQIE